MTFMMILCITLYVNCTDIVELENHSDKRVLAERPNSFIQRNGTHFFLNGKPQYFNGFNAYWLMTFAADPSTSSKVTTVFQEASQHGLNLARTWAFNDAGYKALQTSPGIYDESVFRVLYLTFFNMHISLCVFHAHILVVFSFERCDLAWFAGIGCCDIRSRKIWDTIDSKPGK